MSTNPGTSMIALKKFVYQLRWSALPLTTSKLFLITTECIAVMQDDPIPKKTPRSEIGMASRKTPMKNPKVTTVQEKRMRVEGRVCRAM